MKTLTTTILTTALIALSKLTSVYTLMQIPRLQDRALDPLAVAVLLVAACVRTYKRGTEGPLIAMGVLGYCLMKYFWLGLDSRLIAPFVLQVVGFLLNFGAFVLLRQKPPRAEPPPMV